MLTQVELEKQMYAGGRARADRIMHNNEEQGRAVNNPYSSTLYRRFILPLSEIIREDLTVKKAGAHKAHVKLLEPLDTDAVAFIAVRHATNALLCSEHDSTARMLVTDIGKAVYHELMLKVFEKVNPALFNTLVHSMNRRMSKNERHRMTVFKMQAKAEGIELPEWGSEGVTQVGSYLVNQLELLGMLKTWRVLKGKRQSIAVSIDPEVLGLIDTIKNMVKETMPYYLPCVEKPKDWVAIDDGGWHTDEMRRMMAYAVGAHGSWTDVASAGISTTLQAINGLQSIKWAINRPVLDAVKRVSQHFDMEEVLCQAELPAPPAPEFLDSGLSTSEMSPGQLAEFTTWKHQKRDWYTQLKLRGTKYGRFVSAMKVADMFVDYPEIYFVYFADFRGRLYARTSGVSPQGSDLQKALLRFANGKPLDSLDAVLWFTVHGANKWGYDKDSLQGRAKWVRERHQLIMSFAEDPIANSGWREADCPMQFLAWCFEYADWTNNPDTFLSYLPVGMDGSCNGLQNFSAMLRDDVGGEATNLVPADLPQDIYQRVADVTMQLLRQVEKDEAGYRDMWLKHGINRSLVKRSVMTLPYGSTRFACAGFIVDDYMKVGKAPEFARDQYNKAAQYLSHFVWDAIREVVVKAKDAMDWLQACAAKIIKAGANEIRWTTPAGFTVIQRYKKIESKRVRTSLCGNAFLRIGTELEEADLLRHKNGIAPNFIHSLDAAHLQLTTVAARAEGLDLAMIHDDYGCHASDCPRLSKLIRETFVAMYEENEPLADFAKLYDLEGQPEKGSLNLREVLKSTYFFS